MKSILKYIHDQVGVKLAEMCERLRIKHVIYSAVDFVYRITGNRYECMTEEFHDDYIAFLNTYS